MTIAQQLSASLFIFLGALLIFIASIGMLRMPDILMRMHAATKAGTLGIGLVLTGVTFYFMQWRVSLEATVALGFIVTTAPIASHLIARAAYFMNVTFSKMTFIDELKKYYKTHTIRRLSDG